MNLIMVGTDFSDPAEGAVELAARLAKLIEGSVTLVHVLAVPPLAEGALEQPAQADADLEAAVHDHLDRIAEEWLEGVPSKCVLLRGDDPAQAMISFANEIDASLLMVATHGRTGFKRLLIGSVAETLVRASRRPVLTVPSPVEG